MAKKQNQPRKNALTPTVSILIVDDHPVVREGLAMQLANRSGLEVCGEADSVAVALKQVARLNPTVAVIDIGLKDGNGIDLVQRIKARGHPVRMLVWSMYGESHYAERALRAGALGFVTKDQSTELVIRAIGRVAQGKIFLSEQIQERLLRRSIGGFDDSEVVEIGCFETLSNRELEVFRLIGQAVDTRAIAEKLHLSTKTIETYQARIKEKLNLKTIRELVSCAVRWQGQMPGS